MWFNLCATGPLLLFLLEQKYPREGWFSRSLKRNNCAKSISLYGNSTLNLVITVDARLTTSKTVPRRQGFAHSLLTASGTSCKKSLHSSHRRCVDNRRRGIVIVAFILWTSVLLKLHWSYQLISDKLQQPPAHNDFQLLLTLAIVIAVTYKKWKALCLITNPPELSRPIILWRSFSFCK